MRRLAVALLLTVPFTTPASAASCPMVSDPVGDGGKEIVAGVGLPASDPAMDIESVSLVTDAKRLKVQVVLNQHAPFDTYAPTGRLVRFQIAAKGGAPKEVRITIDPTGKLTSVPAPVNAASLRMEQSTRAIWVAVPLTSLGFHKMRPATVRPRRAGDAYTWLKVTVSRQANGSVVGSEVIDEAGGQLSPGYVHRAASCITF